MCIVIVMGITLGGQLNKEGHQKPNPITNIKV